MFPCAPDKNPSSVGLRTPGTFASPAAFFHFSETQSAVIFSNFRLLWGFFVDVTSIHAGRPTRRLARGFFPYSLFQFLFSDLRFVGGGARSYAAIGFDD